MFWEVHYSYYVFTLALLFSNLYILKIIYYYFIILATIVMFSLSYYGLVCLLVLDTGYLFSKKSGKLIIGHYKNVLSNVAMFIVFFGMEFIAEV